MSDEGSAQRARSSTNPLKILIVGEGAVGKTSLCSVFRVYRELDKEEPPSEEEIRDLLSKYEPTIFENDNYTTTVEDEVRTYSNFWCGGFKKTREIK